MKLLNYTLAYLSVALLAVIGVWAVIFYINMLDEIYDSIDDGLDNSKELIIKKVQEDSTVIHKTEFLESNYAIHPISPDIAILLRDVYLDSTLYMINEQDYEPVRILKTAFRAPNDKYYELMVVSSMVEEDDLIEDLFYALLWLYIFLLASVLIINNVLLKRIWKPFYEILDKLRNFKLGTREELPVVKTRVSEFNILHDTVSSLLQRNIQIFNSQKQFIENASHELQTPLAISINKLELLAEKKPMTDEQLEDVSAVIQSLERLTRLNKTLLMLSRIENRQYPEQREVNFNTLAQRLVQGYADLSEFKSVNLSLNEESTVQYTMNAELAESLLSNLVKNAIVHNYTGGDVRITIAGDTISVSNTGNAAALDATRIFDRFYKNSMTPTSTGLGLAIVKSVADYAGLPLSYQYDGRHCFTIRFPQTIQIH
jgi:signal transduction histidine kinase